MKVSNLIKKLEKYGKVEFERGDKVFITINGDKYGAIIHDIGNGKEVYKYFIHFNRFKKLEEILKNNSLKSHYNKKDKTMEKRVNVTDLIGEKKLQKVFYLYGW